MVKRISDTHISCLEFAVYDEKRFVVLSENEFRAVIVPRGYVFDGISVPWFVMFLFTHNDLKRGLRAACFHDWMCENKDVYGRREATSVLLKLWKQAGLGNRGYTAWKPWVVYSFVEIYQICKRWK